MSQSNEREAPWQVDFGGKAEKQANKLPAEIREILFYLKYLMEQQGPEQTQWRNYSKIVGANDVHH